jgi:hypothetical protein
MPNKQSEPQKETIGRVMHEFKHGELESHGRKVKSRRQAISIALHEAGASDEQSPQQKKHSYSRTKAKEKRGETAAGEKEGKAAQNRVMRRNAGSTRH